MKNLSKYPELCLYFFCYNKYSGPAKTVCYKMAAPSADLEYWLWWMNITTTQNISTSFLYFHEVEIFRQGLYFFVNIVSSRRTYFSVYKNRYPTPFTLDGHLGSILHQQLFLQKWMYLPSEFFSNIQRHRQIIWTSI